MEKNYDFANDSYKRRLEIISYHKLWKYENISLQQISKLTCSSRTMVKCLFEKFEQTGDIIDKSRSGRPTIVSDREKRIIINYVKMNKTCTLGQIKMDNDLQASRNTILRVINNEGIISKTMQKKFYIPDNGVKARKIFAETYLSFNTDFWMRVVWSDEANFVYGGPGQKITVWINFDEDYIPKNVSETSTKFGLFSTGVWGCFLGNGQRYITFYDGRINSEDYINILEEYFVPNLKATRGKYRPILQQDNARCHTAKATTNYFKENNIKTLDWPPYSPDLNPIENIWSLIKRNLSKYTSKYENKKQFQKHIEKLFYDIPDSTLKNLSCSLPNRLQSVLDNKGRWIDY